jgi:hypothetical protein
MDERNLAIFHQKEKHCREETYAQLKALKSIFDKDVTTNS